MNLPPCSCGNPRFRPGSSYIGDYSAANYFCTGCARHVYEIADSGAVVVFRSAQAGGLEKPVTDYINGILSTALRDWRERREDARRTRWRNALAATFYPRFPDLTDYPETRALNNLPWDAKALVETMIEAHKREEYLPIELRRFVPPKIPNRTFVAVFIPNPDGGWEQVDPDESALLSVPRDPILVRDERFFAQVFEALTEDVGGLIEAEDIDNQYNGDHAPRLPPWHRFRLGGTEFVVGQRKRVAAIKATFPVPVPTHDLRTLTVDVWHNTYEAFGPKSMIKLEDLPGWSEAPEEVQRAIARDAPDRLIAYEPGGWNSDLPEAVRFEVHAYNLDQCIAQLRILIALARRAG